MWASALATLATGRPVRTRSMISPTGRGQEGINHQPRRSSPIHDGANVLAEHIQLRLCLHLVCVVVCFQ